MTSSCDVTIPTYAIDSKKQLQRKISDWLYVSLVNGSVDGVQAALRSGANPNMSYTNKKDIFSCLVLAIANPNSTIAHQMVTLLFMYGAVPTHRCLECIATLKDADKKIETIRMILQEIERQKLIPTDIMTFCANGTTYSFNFTVFWKELLAIKGISPDYGEKFNALKLAHKAEEFNLELHDQCI
jgi:hypothetical protein